MKLKDSPGGLGFALAVILTGSLTGADYLLTDIGLGSAFDINSSGNIIARGPGPVRPFIFDGQTATDLTNAWHLTIGSPKINDANEVLTWHEANASIITVSSIVYLQNTQSGRLNSFNLSGVAVGFESNPEWYLVDRGLIANASTGELTVLDYFAHLQDINDAAVIVGMLSMDYETVDGGIRGQVKLYYPARACRMVSGNVEYLDLRTPPATFRTGTDDLSESMAVNSQGLITGWYRPVAPGNRRAFRYVGAGLEDLGTLGGNESVGLDINHHGTIVGWAQVAGNVNHAFRYENGQMTDLNTLLPANSGWVLTSAKAINDRDEIVGEGTFQGVTHGFLLSPSGLVHAPRIASQPVGAELGKGSTHTFSVEVTGAIPMAFQWSKDGVEISGAVASSYTLESIAAQDAGSYRVRVTNAGGTVVSAPATLVVPDPVVSIATYAGITIFGEVGLSYRVEYKNSLSEAQWLPLGSDVTLTVTPQVVFDDSPLRSQRVYRVVKLP